MRIETPSFIPRLYYEHELDRVDPGRRSGTRVSDGLRRRIRAALLVLIVLLYVISVPWYRESGVAPALVLGLPDWVAVALGCYVGVAILNSLAWLLTDVRDPDEDVR